MKMTSFKEHIFDNTRSLKERIFIWLTSIMLVCWCITIVEVVVAEKLISSILPMAGALIVLVITTFICARKHRYKLGAFIVSAVMTFIYLPSAFLWGGGIYGDAPLWFLFVLFYVNVCMSGWSKWLFLVLNCILAVTCWGIAYFHPEMVNSNGNGMAHLYSLLGLLIIGAAMGIMIGFHKLLFEREVEQSLQQKKEIEELNESQNRFFSSMSHEIRTPINTIIGLNEMTLRENASEEINENSMNIQAAGRMLLHLINDILDMSKFESGQLHLNESPYHTGDMLSDIVGMLWLRAKEKGLDFRVSVSPDLPEELIGDEVRIKQILINVLNNAIKYTGRGYVSLSIQCEPMGGKKTNVIYTVTDTGIGIKKESMPYLFDAFKRMDEGRNKYIEGTGLGLSIVKRLVELMGGKITVNSIYTKGSTFIIEIPQQKSGDALIGDIDIGTAHAGEEYQYRQSFEAPDAKILAVDDTEPNLLVIEKLLRDTKVQVTCVSSGSEALKKTVEEPYDIILMDHLMPEMDGVECMHKIRNQIGGFCKESRIIALTANVGSENAKYYAKEGFDGYLVKPVTGDVLEREIMRNLPSNKVNITGDGDEIMQQSLQWADEKSKKAMVAVTTESVADLPASLCAKYNITVLPHMVNTKDGVFKDGIEVEQIGLLDYMRREDVTVRSVGPDAAGYEEFFATQLNRANNIVHIAISSRVTDSACPAAMEAARSFDNVWVVDSLHLSSGQGLMAIEASRMAEEGMSADAIAAAMPEVSRRSHSNFIVDNLDYLSRTGQVGKKIASITKAFLIRPVLVLRRGRMGVGKIYLGSREHAWKRYIASTLRHSDSIDRRLLFVTYVGLTRDDIKMIREEIEKRCSFDEICFVKASPAITANCGPGTFGLLYLTKK